MRGGMGEAQPFTFAGLRVHLHAGVTVAPRWFDLPRRLGLRAKKRVHIIPKGRAYFMADKRAVVIRDDDWPTFRDRCEREARLQAVA